MEITNKSKWARLRISNRYKYLQLDEYLIKLDVYGTEIFWKKVKKG